MPRLDPRMRGQVLRRARGRSNRGGGARGRVMRPRRTNLPLGSRGRGAYRGNRGRPTGRVQVGGRVVVVQRANRAMVQGHIPQGPAIAQQLNNRLRLRSTLFYDN